MIRRRRAAAWSLALASGLGACGSASTDDGIEITDAWARTTPSGATTGAVYLTISSPEDDVLEGATTEAADAAQIHMTMSGTDGTSMMHQVDGLELPAGEDVTLESGGYHVMLIDLVAPLAAETVFEITLQLARSPDVTIEVPVMDDAP